LQAKVGHPFQVIKVRYHGLAKNRAAVQPIRICQSAAGQAVFAASGGINPSLSLRRWPANQQNRG